MELTGPGPISMGSATTAFIVLLCSTIECKSRSLNCRGAALRKGIPTSISIHARVRSRNRNVLRKRNNKK